MMWGRAFFARARRGVQHGFVPALLLALALPDAALAQAGTRACRQLEAQLVGLSGGGSGSARRYDAAIERQREQMDKARAQARRAGCGFAFAGRQAEFCGKINATLARMDKNLADLQRKRAQLGGGDGRRQRARIMAALDAHGCRAPRRAAPEPAADATRAERPARMTPGALSGQFRTLCVRSCDGYYFPISWSVSFGAFERDARACQAMCPGTQVELHHHRVSGEDSEDMVSTATGLPYREMENAFLYRRPGASIPAGCGCGAAAAQGGASGFQTIGGDYAANEPAGLTGAAPATEAAVPLPSLRPDAAEDPETLSSREGGLDAEALKRLATPRPTVTAGTSHEDPGERPIRVVGPAFLPDPEAAAVPQARAPAPGR